jgi:hypothetical protein
VNASEHLSADEALEQIERVRGKVRRSARWAGWLYLFWGISATVYWAAMFLGSSPVQVGAGVFWGLLTVGSFVYIYRQSVYGSGLDNAFVTRLTLAWVVTMVGAALIGTYLLPDEPTGWWVAVALAVSAAAAVPVLYGAWRLRPWAVER